MVAACHDLCKVLAEFYLTYSKVRIYGQNHGGVTQQMKFPSRVTALLVGMLLQGRVYMGEAEDHRGKLYGEGRHKKSVYLKRLKG